MAKQRPATFRTNTINILKDALLALLAATLAMSRDGESVYFISVVLYEVQTRIVRCLNNFRLTGYKQTF